MRKLLGMCLVTAIIIASCFSGAYGAYDTFDSELLETAKWVPMTGDDPPFAYDYARDVYDGRLHLNVRRHATDEIENRNSISLETEDFNGNHIAATVRVEGQSFMADGAYGFARIGGYFFNDAFGPGEYNDTEGDYWAVVLIRLEDTGQLQAEWNVWRVGGPDLSGWELKAEGSSSQPASFDTDYALSIEQTSGQLVFTFAGESDTYDLPETTYEPFTKFAALTSRVYPNDQGGGSGFIKAQFDDVSLQKGALYDDFASNDIDTDKWLQYVDAREVRDGKLHLKVSECDRRGSSRVLPTRTDADYLQADVTVNSSSGFQEGSRGKARIVGTFYNTRPDPDSAVGDVLAAVELHVSSNEELVARARVWETTEEGYDLPYDEPFQTPLSFDTPSTLSVEFTGSEIIFTCNGEELIYGVQNNNSQPVSNYTDLLSRVFNDQGSCGFMSASFDNVLLGQETDPGFDDRSWVTSFYVAYWNRAADPEGLGYWMNLISQGTLDVPGVAENFALSDEAKAQYPYFESPKTATPEDRRQFVRSVYFNLLNRDADQEGLEFWVGELESGATTPGLLIGNVINAAMAANSTDWMTIKNKVAVAEHFVQAIQDQGLAWQGNFMAFARDILGDVSHDPATVADLKGRIDSFFSSQ